MTKIDLLITDLDNTLYDWVGFYVPSFRAMIEEIHRISGVQLAELKQAFRRVHQRHRTTEYAFAIEELDVLAQIDPNLSPKERLEKYDSAIHAFRSSRKKLLKTYPGVRETLARLRSDGIKLVAYSDAMSSYVSRRLRQLEIDTFFDALCASRDHGVPPYLSINEARKSPEQDVVARIPIIELPLGVRKPEVKALGVILDSFSVVQNKVAYVGDSLSRDILMARRAGIIEIWAKYGYANAGRNYSDLLEITYWTDTEVAQEEQLRAEVARLKPNYTISKFPELLQILELRGRNI